MLGVTIDNIDRSQVMDQVASYAQSDRAHLIVTVNPEFIMQAQHDDEFRHILNHADIAVADGFGITLAARRFGFRLKQRIPGIDLLMDIAAFAARTGRRVYLLGARRGVAARTAAVLVKQYPELHIVGAESGYRHWHRPIPDKKLIRMISAARPDILFVAFGQVKQEKWLYHHLPLLPSVRVAMGVGGSFDYISGKIRRAPRWMRKLGLEWLFRLLRQPWRFSRIVTAVIRFSIAVARSNH